MSIIINHSVVILKLSEESGKWDPSVQSVHSRELSGISTENSMAAKEIGQQNFYLQSGISFVTKSYVTVFKKKKKVTCHFLLFIDV